MNKEFVPYAEALVLKELGFDEQCFGFYISPKSYRRFISDTGNNSDLKNMFGDESQTTPTAPLYQQAFRWFREKYGLYDIISKNGYMIEGEINGDFLRITKFSLKSHEEAELDCLRKLIELVKNKK
jgi:hypothetical protein